jgi:hypothetical protein
VITTAATDPCICYLNHPDDPTADQEACARCDYEFWQNPVFIIIDERDDQ